MLLNVKFEKNVESLQINLMNNLLFFIDKTVKTKNALY